MNPEQADAFIKVQKGDNIFITGGAGVGKSFLVSHITTKISKIGVCAMTGCAALLINGSTLHSYLGIGLAKDPAPMLAKKAASFPIIRKRILALDILLIDEVSMLSAELFEKVLEVLNIVRKGKKVQLILVGDPFQLAPIEGNYCFTSPMWATLNFVVCTLTTNMRQADDEPFKELLDRVRWGHCSPNDLATLQGLKNTQFHDGIIPTRLYSKNNNVDQINSSELAKLKTEKFSFLSKYANDPSKNWAKSNKVPDELVLCIGAQVMCTRNLSELGLVNGSRGIITDITDTYIIVELTDGRVARLTALTLKCLDNPFLEITYVPLKLAWAISIHASQGATLSALEVDLGKDIFACGQAYTALSRAQNLSSIRVINVLAASFTTSSLVKNFFTI